MELNDTSTSNLPFENYTGYLLSHGLCSKFCSSLSRLSMDFVKPDLSSLPQQYHLQRSLRSSSKVLFTVTTVNSVTYGERAFSFSARILWNSLPDSVKNKTFLSSFKCALKHSCFGNFIFYLFYEELYLAFMSTNSFHDT